MYKSGLDGKVSSLSTVRKLDVAGYIDGIVYGELRGWVTSPDSKPREVTLFVDGIANNVSVANLERPDLPDNLCSHGKCGFAFDLGHLPEHQVAEISINCLENSFDFHGETLRYCPAVLNNIARLGKLFFAEFYRAENSFEVDSNEEAFEHYLNFGIYEDLDPNPWFSSRYFRENHSGFLDEIDIPILAYLKNEGEIGIKPSACFDPDYYLKENCDLGSMERPFEHYVQHGHSEGRQSVKRELPVGVVWEFKEMMAIDPVLSELGCGDDLKIMCYPTLTADTYLPKLLRMKYSNRIDAVICVPHIKVGGADLYASCVLKAYQANFGKQHVLLLVTEQSKLETNHLIDDDSLVHYLVSDSEVKTTAQKQSRMHCLLGVLAPSVIFNVNSFITWELYRNFGKQLSSRTKLLASVFCFDSKSGDRVSGYLPDYLPDTIQWMDKVYTDNRSIIEEIKSIYGFSGKNQDKLHVLYAPCIYDLAPCDQGVRAPRSNDKVLWVGRMTEQKRPDILLQIARVMPNLDFVVYGPEGETPEGNSIVKGEVNNIDYRGVFESPEELDYSEFCMFLNTSDWDGLPNALIQVAMTGLPVISTNVGGIKELIDSNTGWLIEKSNRIEEFVCAMRQVIVQRDVALERGKRARELVQTRHSWEKFYNTLESTSAFSSICAGQIEKSTKPIERRRYRLA